MMNFSSWLAFLIISLSAAFSPGPAVLMVMNTAARLSVYDAMFSSIGNAFGLIILSILVMSGLTYLLQESAWIFLLVKIGGAMYLISIGLRQIYESFKSDTDVYRAKSGMLTNDGRFALFRQGVWIALSNPKAILFLSSVFPQFLTMDNIQWSQFLILLSTFVFCCLLSHTFYMWLILNLGKRLPGQVWANRAKRVFGSLFIVIGISLLGVNTYMTS